MLLRLAAKVREAAARDSTRRSIGGPEPLRVGDVLVVKEVERADTPPRGRQAGEIFEPDRTAHISDEKPMSQKKNDLDN